jgi:cytochrome c-type biogenesis protein CcmH
MTTFFIIALVIAMAGSAMVLGPLLRTFFRGHDDDPKPGVTVGTGVIVALLIPVAALVLYSRWTSWNWSAGGQVPVAQGEEMHSMNEAVAGLERRLQEQPDDIQGWQMLGRSYINMRSFDKAAEAYARVVELTGGDNVAALADYGEALFLSSSDGMAGEAGNLFRDLVPRAPDNPKVMWYGGIAAFEAGDDAQGTRLWTRLLDMNPPDAMRQMIEDRIGTAPSTEAPAASAAASPAEALEPVADGVIRVRVSVDPFLAQQVNGSVPLFIFARGAAGGPPLAAVRRSAGELPLVLDLSDESAMIDGVQISDQDSLTLVARLSMSGSPRQQSGDFFGQVSYSRDDGSEVEIRIDQVVP